MTEPEDGPRRLNPVIIALLAGFAVLLVLLWYFSGDRDPDQDKLSNPQIEQSAAQTDSVKQCSDGAVYGLIKRQLFARAAQARGTDQATFAEIAGVAALRVENPVFEGDENGLLNCSGTFYLDLPPGVAVAGGQHSLTADIDYAVQPPANGGGWAVQLRNADPIVSALATLTQAPAVDPLAPLANSVAPEGNVAASESAAVQPGPATGSPGRPSFDCANARSSGEAAVCADSGLAALDVTMAAQYRRALASATPAQKTLLQSTRDRFLAYRDRCPSRQCMADGYVGRMREIRDIMEGRFQPR